MKKYIPRTCLSLILPLFLLFLWGYIARSLDNPLILPMFTDVAEHLFHPNRNLISLGTLFSNIIVSMIRVSVGYILAVCIALPLGIIMGYNGKIYQLFNSVIGLFRPIPPIAWVPLVLAWFGLFSFATILGVTYGDWFVYLDNFKISMIFIIFIGAFFPLVTSSIHAVQNVKRTLIESARVLGANEFDIFTKVLIPGAMPTMVNGMRIGLGQAWMCLVAAEMLPGSLSGVGYLITHAYELARIDIVITGMVSIGIIGASLDLIFRYFEEHKYAWQQRM